MNNLIERLKEKPEQHRRHYTFGISAFFTAFIFILWASVILPGDVKNVSEKQASKPKGDTPITTLRGGVASVYQGAKSLFEGDGSSGSSFETQYESMKSQVENGEVRMIPTPPNSQ